MGTPPTGMVYLQTIPRALWASWETKEIRDQKVWEMRIKALQTLADPEQPYTAARIELARQGETAVLWQYPQDLELGGLTAANY